MTARVNRAQTTSDTEDGRILRLNGVPFTGEVVDTVDGRVAGVTEYRDGLEHGPSVEYFPGGGKQLEGQSAAGYAVGEWREWYPSGKLKSSKLLDRWGDIRRTQTWDESGVLVVNRESQGLHGGEW